MEWYEEILLYLAVWLMGFFTGVQAGAAKIMRALAPARQPPPTTLPPDLQAAVARLSAMTKKES